MAKKVYYKQKIMNYVDLGPARVHVFEIDTPNIENFCDKIYKQNL